MPHAAARAEGGKDEGLENPILKGTISRKFKKQAKAQEQKKTRTTTADFQKQSASSQERRFLMKITKLLLIRLTEDQLYTDVLK